MVWQGAAGDRRPYANLADHLGVVFGLWIGAFKIGLGVRVRSVELVC